MENNPANQPAKVNDAPSRRRIPMSTPMRKLEVPEIPGFHCHWFIRMNVPRALQGGYEYVNVDEVPVNQTGIGADSSITGSSDLGSRITINYGTAADGQGEVLVLMKIREEWWKEDQAVIAARNASTMSAIFKEEKIPGIEKSLPVDQGLTYVKTAKLDAVPLLNRPARKAR